MPQETAHLVVGLGNPGPEYELTPHNLGFRAIDRLAERNGIRVSRKESMALAGVGSVAGRPVILAKPQTYMNVSGPTVKGLLERHSLSATDLILIYDEMDLPWTSLRIKPRGSAAGHNGVRSVIGSIGTDEFTRVRLGIDLGRSTARGVKLVLGRFKRAQHKELEELLDYASQAVESIIAEGVEMSMTKFNRRAPGLNQEEE